MGPPESPEQESLPPCDRPAQNMLVEMMLPYSLLQEEREMTGTETLFSLEGSELEFSLVVPLLHD